MRLGEKEGCYEKTPASKKGAGFCLRAFELAQAFVSAVVFDLTELPEFPELFSLTCLLVLFSPVCLLLPFALGVLPFRLSVT